MDSVSTVPGAAGIGALLDDFSLEITGKDADKLEEASDTIPPGPGSTSRSSANENLRMRLVAARAARRLGFVPVPHISARRLRVAVGARGVPCRAAGGRHRRERLRRRRRPCRAARSLPGRPCRSEIRVAEALRRAARQPERLPRGPPRHSGPALWSALEAKAAVLRGAAGPRHHHHAVRFRHRPGPVLDRGGAGPRHRPAGPHRSARPGRSAAAAQPTPRGSVSARARGSPRSTGSR